MKDTISLNFDHLPHTNFMPADKGQYKLLNPINV